jgi:hypothetical protein
MNQLRAESPTPANENDAEKTVSVLRTDFARSHDDDDSAPGDSARAQKLQDEQAARAAAEAEETSEQTDDNAAPQDEQARRQNPYLVGHKCGKGVYDIGDELHLRAARGKPLTPQQIQDAIKAAIGKGWTEIHVFKADGTPDIALAMQIQQTIIQMGVYDRIKCCTNPAETKHIDDFKAACAGVATAAVAATAVAGAAALAQQLAPR